MTSQSRPINSSIFEIAASATMDDSIRKESHTAKDIRRQKYLRAQKAEELMNSRNTMMERFTDSLLNWDRVQDKDANPSFSKQETDDYYRMLSSRKAKKLVKKMLRKSRRQIEEHFDSIATEASLADYMTSTKSFTVDSFSSSYEALLSVIDSTRTGARNLFEALEGNLFIKGVKTILNTPEAKSMFFTSILTLQLLRSQSITDDIILLGQYLAVNKMFDRTNYEQVFGKVYPYLVLIRCSLRLWSRKGDDNLVVTEADLSDIMFDSRNKASDFLTSHFVKSISEIIMILASYHLFSRDIAKELGNWIGFTKRPKNIPEAMSKITTNLASMVKMAESVAKGLPLSDIFLAADPMSDAQKKASRLLMEGEALYFGLPEEHKFDSVTWIDETTAITNTILKMDKIVGPYDTRYVSLRNDCAKLLAKLKDVMGRAQCVRRKQPYFVILTGTPGIGKGTIMDYILQMWAHLMGREFSHKHVFQRVCTSPYWDGISAGTPYVHISELGALNKKMVSIGMDKAALEITSLVDNQPYCLDMAKLESKGTTFFNAEIIIADTNNLNLNLDQMVDNYAAFKRRGLYVVPRVRPEFCKDGATALDPLKEIEGGDPMDKWYFEVFRYDAVDNKDTTTKVLLGPEDKADIVKFAAVMTEDMEKHIHEQTKNLEMASKNHAKRLASKIAEEREKRGTLEGSQLQKDLVHVDNDFDEKSFLWDKNFINMGDGVDWSNIFTEADGEELPGVQCGCCKDGIHVLPLKEIPLASVMPDKYENLLCGCCEHGVHTMETTEAFVANLKIGWESGKKAMWNMLLTCIIFLSSIHVLFDNADMFIQVMICIVCLILSWYVPYFFYLLLLSCVMSAVSYMFEKAFNVLSGSRIMRMLETANHAQDALSDWSGWLQRKQTLAVQVSTKVSLILLALGVAGGLSVGLYWMFGGKKKKVTEGTYFSTSETISELKMTEQYFGMSDPGVRIKRNEKVKTYDNIKDDLLPPLHTTGSAADFYTTIKKNIRPFSMLQGNTIRKGYSLGIGERCGIINKHYFKPNGGNLKLSFASSVNNVDAKGDYVYGTTRIYDPQDFVDLGDDLVMFSYPLGFTVTNIVNHLPTDKIVMRNMPVHVNGVDSYANDCSPIRAWDAYLEAEVVQTNVAAYTLEGHKPGMCGLPIIASVSGGFYIAGMHASGNKYGATSYMIKLNRSMMKSAMTVCTEGGILHSNNILKQFDRIGGEPDARSWTRYVDQGPTVIHGKIHEFTGNQKSDISTSIFGERKSFLEEMFEFLPPHQLENFMPARMSPGKNKLGVYGSPITVGVQKLTVNHVPLDPKVMKVARDRLIKRLISNLEVADVVADLQPIDMLSVANGNKDDWLCRPVDMSKGGGFEYSGKKQKYFNEYDMPDGKQYEPVDRLAQDIVDIIDSYHNNNLVRPIFVASLKDEVRTVSKFNAFKTRIFYATPTPFLMVQKALTSPIYTLMIEHCDAFYTALGVDMHRHGHEIREQMQAFAESKCSNVNIIEGDYGGFDTSMPYEISEAAAYVVYSLARHFGYSKLQLALLNGVLTDLLEVRVDFFGDLMSVPGLQPSGKYATAEDNSIRNILILMYAWYSDEELSKKDFFEHVLPKVYGDDFLAAVTDWAAPRFNNITLCRMCGEMGMEMTTSSKSAVEEPFIPLESISFLKRTFRYHAGLNRFVATLHPSSLMKTLQFVSLPKNCNPERHYESVLNSVLTEYFFWMDTEKEYSDFRDYLHSVVMESFPGVEEISLFTYEFLLDRYNEGVDELVVVA